MQQNHFHSIQLTKLFFSITKNIQKPANQLAYNSWPTNHSHLKKKFQIKFKIRSMNAEFSFYQTKLIFRYFAILKFEFNSISITKLRKKKKQHFGHLISFFFKCVNLTVLKYTVLFFSHSILKLFHITTGPSLKRFFTILTLNNNNGVGEKNDHFFSNWFFWISMIWFFALVVLSIYTLFPPNKEKEKTKYDMCVCIWQFQDLKNNQYFFLIWTNVKSMWTIMFLKKKKFVIMMMINRGKGSKCNKQTNKQTTSQIKNTSILFLCRLFRLNRIKINRSMVNRLWEREKNGRRKEKKTWRQQWKEKLYGKFSEIFSFSKKFPNVVVVSLAVVKLRLKFVVVVVVIWTKLTQNEHHNNITLMMMIIDR